MLLFFNNILLLGENIFNYLKVVSVFSGGIIASLLSISSISAAQYNAANEVANSKLPDSAKVIKLPDGGILHGKMTIIHASGSQMSYTTNYNSDTDKNAITVKALNSGVEPVQSGESMMSTMGLYPSNDLYVLYNQASYQSQPFTGSGWRFAGYKFAPSSGTGQYLRWNAFFDQGRVGTVQQAWATKNGSVSGTVVGGLYAKYVAGTTTFYTYNPAYNMYYLVENK